MQGIILKYFLNDIQSTMDFNITFFKDWNVCFRSYEQDINQIPICEPKNYHQI